MPLDSLGYRPESSDEAFKRRCIGWEKKYTIFPRKCAYTDKIIWLKTAYFGTSMLTGPGEPIFEHRWVHPKDFLFLKIKGVI
jgi:hypothetical protein